MRRKSSRSASKTTEKSKTDSPKTSRGRLRRQKKYSSDDNSDEDSMQNKDSPQCSKKDSSDEESPSEKVESRASRRSGNEQKKDNSETKRRGRTRNLSTPKKGDEDVQEDGVPIGKSKNTYGSTNVEQETENKNVQVTPQSPSNPSMGSEQNLDQSSQKQDEVETIPESTSRHVNCQNEQLDENTAQREMVADIDIPQKNDVEADFGQKEKEMSAEKKGFEESNLGYVETANQNHSEMYLASEVANTESETKKEDPPLRSPNTYNTEPAVTHIPDSQELDEQNLKVIREESFNNNLASKKSVSKEKLEDKKPKKIVLKRTELSRSSLTEDKPKTEKLSEANQETEEKSSTPPLAEKDWSSVYEKTEKNTREDKTAQKIISLKRKSQSDKSSHSELEKLEIKKSSSGMKQISKDRHRRKSSSEAEHSSTQTTEKPAKKVIRVKLNRKFLSQDNEENDNKDKQDQENQTGDVQSKKKSKWDKLDVSSVKKIDVDTLKSVCNNLELVDESELKLEVVERRISVAERRNSESNDEFEKTDDDKDYNSSTENTEPNPHVIAINRKISIVDDTASKLRPPPSPAKNPVSEVLFITNLVRPFTIKQLKELLGRTGKIKDDGFWTDRIKSKCYVQYESTGDAEATRNALHGVNWPIGNGKKLCIEYATEEDLEKAKNPPLPAVMKEKTPEKENKKPEKTEIAPHRHSEDHEREGRTRQWDVEKEDVRRRHSRSHSRERVKRHIRRSHTPEDYHKKRRHEEPPPQKLMDDLFLKTKATPSIYWQPLSPEEIALKQKQRLVRMEEHKRRLEENRSRPRDNRAPPYRRR